MAYHQNQPCDTYFVEDAYAPARSHQREYIKENGIRKQQAMADELSRQACDTYMEDIIAHMRHMEDETLADVASIDIQQEIQWFMRPYLIDFLIEAHAAFQLLPETLFLAVNLLDRYCAKRVVYKRHYQLVGCAALLIASKYGDRKERVPMIRELKSMCCSLYEEDMFTQMEWHVLNTLDWVIGHPTVDTWLQVITRDSISVDESEVEHMSWYLCEIALYHKEFVSKKPSVMAQASLALARGILGRPEGMDGHDLEVNKTLLELSQKIDRPSTVLYRKYASPVMSGVSASLLAFLRHQETLLRQQEAATRRAMPPTPPCETSMQKPMHQEMYPGTPVKSYGNGSLVSNGYMTPPITPEGDCFMNGSGVDNRPYQQAPRCPTTPTPPSNKFPNYLPSQSSQHYQQPPSNPYHYDMKVQY